MNLGESYGTFRILADAFELTELGTHLSRSLLIYDGEDSTALGLSALGFLADKRALKVRLVAVTLARS